MLCIGTFMIVVAHLFLMDCCRKAEPQFGKNAAGGLLFHPDPILAGGYFVKC